MVVRIGIIGCGLIANLGHALWYKENSHAEITAVADPNPKHLKKFASKYKVQNKFEDPIDLIESGEVDALSICSPHWAHCSQVVKSLKEGLHVLVEKPMAISMEECDLIAGELKKANVVFQAARQKRFHHAHQKIKQMLEKGKIGVPFQTSIYWYHYIPDLSTGFFRGALDLFKKLGIDLEDKMGAWRLTDRRASGGDLMDHLPHYYDLFRFWLGEPEYLSADILRVFPGRSHEDHGIIQIKYKCGALGLVERSQNVIGRPLGQEKGYIHGTDGSVYWDAPHEYTLKPVNAEKFSKRDFIFNKAERIAPPRGVRKAVSYKRQVDMFIARILEDPDLVDYPVEWAPGYADGRAALEGVIASYISSLEKRKVDLPLKKSEYTNFKVDFEEFLEPIKKKKHE